MRRGFPVLAMCGALLLSACEERQEVLAGERGISWVVVDYDELRGIERNEMRLF